MLSKAARRTALIEIDDEIGEFRVTRLIEEAVQKAVGAWAV